MCCDRLAKREQLDAEGLLDLEACRDERLQQLQPDADCDDDQQLICPDGRRSPRRWFLPSPQGGATALNRCSLMSLCWTVVLTVCLVSPSVFSGQQANV